MQPSDFLTLLGLGLAIWSFIPKKERNFILLFFSKLEILLLALFIFFILFLLSFDWLKENWFPSLSVFTIKKGIPASIWAYMISLLLISFPILKVSFSFFSSSRLNNLILLYTSLIKEDEIDLLVGYIAKYHVDDIQKYLIGISHLSENNSIDIVMRRRTKSDEEHEKLIQPKRIEFAANVYGHIIQNEYFIKKASSKYPELFATIFKGMESENAANEDLVKLYIEIIFETKNQLLIRELKIMNDSNSSIELMNKNFDLPILTGLLVNTLAASANHVWYPVGEGAIKSLKFDAHQKEFLLKEYDSDLEQELWNQKIWIATIYFNYMVRETIFRDSEWHMWLFYFRSSTDLLIENIPLENRYSINSEHPSFNHYIIYHQFHIMLEWLELSKEQENDNRVIDTIRCLGCCINSICQADERKLSKEFKARLLNQVITLYLDYSDSHDNIACTTAREWLKTLFLNPKGVDSGAPIITEEYKKLMSEVWKEFDKVPFTAHGNEGVLRDFENSILIPIGVTLRFD